jgi:hypothetical protein
MESAWLLVQDYARFYWQYGNKLWNTMTPMQYGMLLVGIAVCGYLLMKNSVKGP